MQPFVFKYMHISLHLNLVFFKELIISDCHFLNEITCIKGHRGRILELYGIVFYIYIFLSVL